MTVYRIPFIPPPMMRGPRWTTPWLRFKYRLRVFVFFLRWGPNADEETWRLVRRVDRIERRFRRAQAQYLESRMRLEKLRRELASYPDIASGEPKP